MKIRPALLISFLCAAILFCFIAYIFRHEFILRGRINDRMVLKADFLTHLPGPLFIDSEGGDAQSAEAIGKLIYNRNKSIYILSECSSACAEFFIPAAKKISVSRDSLIGFHRNDLMAYSFLSGTSSFSRYCGMERVLWLSKIYKERRLNINFNKEIISKLGIEPIYDSNLSKGGGCYRMVSTSIRSVWYPTSWQLRHLLGIKIGHPICADDERCWKSALHDATLEGSSYVVGDQVYTGGGRERQ